MEALQELRKQGEVLGYKGESLREFVKEQQAQQRDERAVQREKEKLELEVQREKEKAEREVKLALEKASIEKEKLELEVQREKVKAEREVKLALEKASIEKEKLELEVQRASIEKERLEMEFRAKQADHEHQLELIERRAQLGIKGNGFSQSVPKGPKIPAFDDGKDDMDSYLRRFERYAEVQQWSKHLWATHLSALLKGKALDVYALMPADQALDYDALKEALLKRYDLTEDGFNHKFKTGKPEMGETFMQFSVRLASYLTRWLTMSKTDQTCEGLYDLVLRDQFLQMCNKELALFLKERTPKTIMEMATLADQFREARFTRAVNLTKPGMGTHLSNGSRSHNKRFEHNREKGLPKNEVFASVRMKRCFRCGKMGHIATHCSQPFQRSKIGCLTTEQANTRVNFRNEKSCRYDANETTPKVCGACVSYSTTVTTAVSSSKCVLSTSCNVQNSLLSMPTTKGWLGKEVVSVLRDTGCNGVVVRKCYIPEDKFTGNIQKCMLADGSKIEAPIAQVKIDTPYFTGEVEVWCLEHPLYDLILGNIENARAPNDPDPEWKLIQAVQTRQQTREQGKKYPSLKVPDCIKDCATPDDIRKAQENDPTLQKIAKLADEGRSVEGKATFYRKRGILYREFKSPTIEGGKIFRQLVVPQQYRDRVLKLAHESIMSGHMGTKRTVGKVLIEFFWPGVQSDTTRFCQSCDICQRTITKGRVGKVPLGKMPLIDEPFRRVAVDLVGPLKPATEKGNRYILTLVDYATRYPEAVALKGIEAERVAEALVEIFCRVGVPREMLTDMGTQFTSSLMAEVSRLISLKQLTTTPYHPMCNGLVERFNGTLKQMLKRLCAERPKDWDKYLSAVLFAYRDAPQESLGFSPFELVYGHTVRGPMTILKELWTREIEDPRVRSTYQYVIDLRERLESTCELARENLGKAANRYKHYYNKKTIERNMKVGEKVLVLLPTDHNKLTMQWKGPYTIVDKVSNVDYKLDMKGKIKTFHANMLKLYLRRTEPIEVSGMVNVAVIDVQESDDLYIDELGQNPNVKAKECPKDVSVNGALNPKEIHEVRKLLNEFPDVLSDLPGHTTLAEHDIKLLSDTPIRIKPYPLPFAMREIVNEEVSKMLNMGIIEHSDSPYSSPIVIVKKKDNTNRFCIDFRMINKITIFDAEPMPNADEIFANLTGGKYISRLDLSKGYWQMPMTETAKKITAFQTPMGLFHFNVMPFGLVNAPASFSRLMRKLLQDMKNTDNFIDDIIIYTTTFEEHVQILKELLLRLRKANLTAKPSKCFIGFQSLECLGHIVGNQRLEPMPDKIKAITEEKPPETKKQVKSILGLVGFYRRFIPNFATIATPLTDLTKKGQPNKVIWEFSQENAFSTLKNALTHFPILKLPDVEKPFILQTDASEKGAGAVLLQTEEGMKMPVAYASRKFKNAELNYATIEKECLALVWAVQKFERYLYGREFVLETDHQPLVYLSRSKMANARLMRWALILQPYRYRIVAIKGSENVGADCLSRL